MNSISAFDNTEIAFKNKNDKDLSLSLWLFKLMGNPFLVKLFSKLAVFSLRLRLPVSTPIKATIFRQFCGGESIEESKEVVNKLSKSHIGSILDYSVEGKERDRDFHDTAQEVIKIIWLAKNNPAIPYTSLKITGIARFALLEKLNKKQEMEKDEKLEFEKVNTRMANICDNAFRKNVPIYFDAEESWIQDAIDILAEKMMEKYNTKKAIVLTTLQMYKWDRPDYLKHLIEMARTKNFFLGIKLVRGAYLEKENQRSEIMGYKSPIYTTKQDTDLAFDEAVTICLQNIDIVTLCAGTHNEASTLHLIHSMKKMEIPNNHPHVYFSQLYGMSDHITYNLADAGYNVTKYLPYGPVKSVIPYLIRRAEENTAIAGQIGRELKLIIEEKKRRAHSGKLFTKTASSLS